MNKTVKDDDGKGEGIFSSYHAPWSDWKANHEKKVKKIQVKVSFSQRKKNGYSENEARGTDLRERER